MRALLTLLFVGGLLAPAAGARAQPVVDAPEPGDDGAADAETPEPGAPGEAGSPPPPLVAPPEDQAPSPAEEEARLLDRAAALARRRGDLETALADSRRAAQLAPTVERLWAVADLQGALRDEVALRATLEGLLALGPEDPRAPEARARLARLSAVVPPPPPPDADLGDGSGGGGPSARGADEEGPTEDEGDGEEGGGDILDEPWFWVVAAVVGAGAVVAALLLSADAGVAEPIPGDDGFVVRTLVEWP